MKVKDNTLGESGTLTGNPGEQAFGQENSIGTSILSIFCNGKATFDCGMYLPGSMVHDIFFIGKDAYILVPEKGTDNKFLIKRKDGKFADISAKKIIHNDAGFLIRPMGSTYGLLKVVQSSKSGRLEFKKKSDKDLNADIMSVCQEVNRCDALIRFKEGQEIHMVFPPDHQHKKSWERIVRYSTKVGFTVVRA